MNIIKRFKQEDIQYEYGLAGIRLLPWANLNIPFGGAYCIVAPHTSSLEHINEPQDEEELFICMTGQANLIIEGEVFPVFSSDIAFIPQGKKHYIHNNTAEPFHFYALWWNKNTAKSYLNNPILA